LLLTAGRWYTPGRLVFVLRAWLFRPYVFPIVGILATVGFRRQGCPAGKVKAL
jgi:hypothetical protein